MSSPELPFILLGAGASVDAGVPTTTDMTAKMLSHFEDPRQRSGKTAKIIKFVGGGIQMMRGTEGESPLKGLDIEELFATVEMLADRHSLPIAPFVAQWHTAIDEVDESKLSKRDFRPVRDLIEDIAQFSSDGSSGNRFKPRRKARKFGEALKKLLGKVGSEPDGRSFRNASQQMITALANFVWIEDAAEVSYLSKLIRATAERGGTIATLNYDNGIELAAESEDLTVNTGMDHWSKRGTFPESKDEIELLKLHGSVDWLHREKRQVSGDEDAIFPIDSIRQLSADELEEMRGRRSYRPAVIFGAGDKLTAEGPFLELFQTFQHRLEERQELLTIGYSFRDPHLNHVIYRWMNGDPNRHTVIVDHPSVEQEGHALWRDRRRQPPVDRFTFMNVGAVDGIDDYFSKFE
jgi:hypothetical protein